MKENREPEWVEVAVAGQDEEASLIAGLLQSENIPCEVEGPSASPWPENLGSFGWSRVMVPPDRAEEARALIASRQRQYRERPLEEGDEPSNGGGE